MSWLVAFCLLAVGACLGAGIAAIARRGERRRQAARIEELVDYLEAVSLGQRVALEPSGEDELSRLRDEIDKTVSALKRTRDDAIRAREGYAHNLSNIAHQIKTPVAAISLAASRLPAQDDVKGEDAVKTIEAQLTRLTALQGDLLRLTRIDAGAMPLNPQMNDVYTLLSGVVDCVSEQARHEEVSVEIVDGADVELCIDAHWTHEALVNIVNDCIACAPAGSCVTLTYAEYPLYVEIVIADQGPGFSDDDILCLFERFYVGEHASQTSTGLGLAFACEIVELQNGSIRARNAHEGGARFEIRFYRHPAVTSGA